MLCPNCKTELIEVNGRYICSDCGKEVPENEVMTSDWGNSKPATDGIYEESNEPLTSQPQTVEQVLQDQSDAATEVPATVETPVEAPSESVEEVLQAQADEAAINPTEPPVEMPAINLDIPEEKAPEAQEAPTTDSGFYSAPTELTPENGPEKPLDATSESAEPPVLPVTPVAEPEVQNIPVNVPPVPPVSPEPVPETPAAQQPEVVKDMFEDVPAAPVNDPGLYTNNYIAVETPMDQPAAVSTVPFSTEKRMNILILAVGAVLGLCLIGGGTWAYVALSKKASPVIVPVIDDNQATAWQELQVVDGGFKISFPGQPEKNESTQIIGGLDTQVITESYTSEDAVYTAAYATVNANAEKLPTLVDDLAKSQNLDVVTTKVGTYFTASAVDFTLGRDSAIYKGKIMLKNNSYTLVMAGSGSGQSVEYDKFIKSFSFITGDTKN